MDLVQQNYPEGYRISYNRKHHAFQIYVKSQLSQRVLFRLNQWGLQLANHQASGINVDPFSNQSASWGYGSCVHMVSVNTSWDTWECVLNPEIRQMTADIREKTTNNIACSLSILFDSLNACMRDLPTLDPLSNEQIQIASVITCVENKIPMGAPIGSSLSKNGRRTLERIATCDSIDIRVDFFEGIVKSMFDAYQIVNPDQETRPNQDVSIANSYGAAQSLLSVGLYGDWRIHFECIGASLCVTPKYDTIGEERGADLEPHNTDIVPWQIVLLAGLCTCYQQLFPELKL